MKINKMTSYGVRVIGRMSLSQGTIMTSRQLADLETIPQGMVMKVLRNLKNAGIVESKQGRGEITGGFTLKKDVKKITLYHLIMAMEDDIYLYPAYEKRSYKGDLLPLYDEMRRIHDAYILELKTHSVYDILKEQEDKEAADQK